MIKKFKIDLPQHKKNLNMDKPLNVGTVEITFNGNTFAIDLIAELKIKEDNLIESMVNHAGTYGWWAGVNATAKRMLRDLKREAAKNRANFDSEARSALKEQDIKVTEAAVGAWLASDPRVSSKNEEISDLEDLVDFTETALKALEHKRDMLKEINRAQCSEQFNERT